jgi:hypothetical protein
MNQALTISRSAFFMPEISHVPLTYQLKINWPLSHRNTCQYFRHKKPHSCGSLCRFANKYKPFCISRL